MSPEVTIRPALPKDDAAVGELLVQAFTQVYARKMPEVVYTEARKQQLRDTAGKRQVAHVWVAELEGQVVGTVALFPVGALGSEAWLPGAVDLRHLGVAPAHHGSGISSALMDAAEQKARDLKARAICLHVRRGAQGVARYHQQRGYRRDPTGDLDRPTVFLEGFARFLG